jgi:CubicO group peptidase (beta-lactamase class C family)
MTHSAEEPGRHVPDLPPAQLLPATGRALLRRAAAAQADGRLPSLAAGVMREGTPAWFAGRGAVDGVAPAGDTQYRIGSLTKMFVAVAVLRLRDEAVLRLTDPLGEHLPIAAAGGLRIGELLAHTGGLASDSAGPWWERTPGDLRPGFAEVLGSDEGKRHPAGRRFHYSNVGFALLGAMVARKRGRPWHEVIQDEILAPLEMSRTSVTPRPSCAAGWAVHPWADLLLPEPAYDAGLMAPAGQLWSTANDLCRFAAFLSTGADEVLPAASLAEMREPAAPGDGDQASGYGLGLQLAWSEGHLRYGHSGSVPGFISALWVSESGVGAVALANATSGYAMATLAADLIGLTEYHEPPIPPEWRAASAVDPAVLSLIGTWYWGPSPQILRVHDNNQLSLAPLSDHTAATRFEPAGDGTWRARNGYHAGELLRVVTRPDGTVSHLDLASLIFTRQPYEASPPVPGGIDPDGWRPG